MEGRGGMALWIGGSKLWRQGEALAKKRIRVEVMERKAVWDLGSRK